MLYRALKFVGRRRRNDCKQKFWQVTIMSFRGQPSFRDSLQFERLAKSVGVRVNVVHYFVLETQHRVAPPSRRSASVGRRPTSFSAL